MKSVRLNHHFNSTVVRFFDVAFDHSAVASTKPHPSLIAPAN